MIEYSEKYKSYAEEFQDAIVCWKEPAENHTEEGEKIIEAYHQNYLVIAHEIMYEVGDMLAGLCGDDTIQKIYDSYIFKDESKALNKLKKLLGRPIIFPEDSVFYYADTPYKKIRFIELGYKNNFEKVDTWSVCNSNGFCINR